MKRSDGVFAFPCSFPSVIITAALQSVVGGAMSIWEDELRLARHIRHNSSQSPHINSESLGI